MAAPVWRASSHPGSAGERAGLLAAGSAGLRATPLLGRKQETELFPLSKNNLYIHNIINFWWWDNVPKPQYIELKTEENYLICSHWQKLVVSTLVGWLWTMHYFKPFCIISVGILNIRHYERPKLWTFDITSVLLQCFFCSYCSTVLYIVFVTVLPCRGWLSPPFDDKLPTRVSPNFASKRNWSETKRNVLMRNSETDPLVSLVSLRSETGI